MLWIAVWALVPPLNAAANVAIDAEGASPVWEQRTVFVVLNYVALSLAIVISLWGTGRIARRLETLRATAAELLEGDSWAPFRGMNSTAGPLLLTGAASLVFAAGALVHDGWAAAFLRGATWIVVGIALWTFLWTYGSLQFGLDRLGRERLRPDAVHVDPGLGLRPLGGVGFMGLWMLLVSLVPVVLTGLPDVAGATIGIVVLGGGLAAFFFSLQRLHRQMVDVKTSELALARDLYARAYEPVRTAPTLEVLERQQSLLSAADSLEKRARAIYEWPIDDATFTRLITITTSVVAMIIGRLILDPLGF